MGVCRWLVSPVPILYEPLLRALHDFSGWVEVLPRAGCAAGVTAIVTVGRTSSGLQHTDGAASLARGCHPSIRITSAVYCAASGTNKYCTRRGQSVIKVAASSERQSHKSSMPCVCKGTVGRVPRAAMAPTRSVTTVAYR
jgi:hypothetical protein